MSRAISVNRPDLLFLNHVDYFDYSIHQQPYLTDRAVQEVHELECRVGHKVDRVGVGPGSIICRPASGWLVRDFAFEALRTTG